MLSDSLDSGFAWCSPQLNRKTSQDVEEMVDTSVRLRSFTDKADPFRFFGFRWPQVWSFESR